MPYVLSVNFPILSQATHYVTASLGLRGPLAKKRTAGACRSVESGGLTTLPPDHCYQKPAGASILAILVPSSAILDGGVPGWPIHLVLRAGS